MTVPSNKGWRWALAGLFAATVLLSLLPHLFIMQQQRQAGADIAYSPAVLNRNWTRFDDIIKLYPSWRFASDLTLRGKLGIAADRDRIFPNVLQEAVVVPPNALAIWLTGSLAAPFYLATVLVGFAAVAAAMLMRRWTGRPALSLAAAFLMIFAYQYFFLDYLKAQAAGGLAWHVYQMKSLTTSVFEYNSFYRAHSLGATYVLFLGFVWWLWRALNRGTLSWRFLGAGAVLLALQFYAYLFYSLLAAGMTACALAATFVHWVATRAPEPRARLFVLVGASALAMLLALPSWLNTLSLLTGPRSADWVARISGVVPKGAFWASTEVAVFGVAALLLLRDASLRIVFAGAAATVLLVENLQLLFGFNVQMGHIYHRGATPLFFLGMFLFIDRLTAPALRWRAARAAGTAVLAAACLLYGAAAVTWAHNYARQNADQGLLADERQVLDFLRANNGPRTTWAIPFPNLNERAALHAHAILYLPFAGNQPPSRTNAEIKDRLAKMLWLSGVTPEGVRAYVVPGTPERQFERYAYYVLQRLYAPYGPRPLDELAAELQERIDALERSHASPDSTGWPTFLVLGGDGPIIAALNRPRPDVLTPEAKFGRFTVYRVGAAAR